MPPKNGWCVSALNLFTDSCYDMPASMNRPVAPLA